MKKLIYIAATLTILPNIAHAYIDPGSGSTIMAAVLFGFMSLSIFFKAYWHRLKELVSGKKNSPVISGQAEEPAKHPNKTNKNSTP